MTRAAPDWPSKNTRALIAGKYDRLFQQTSKLFGEELAYVSGAAIWLAVPLVSAGKRALRALGVL